MSTLLANLLLAFTWSALTGEFSAGNLLAGFVLGYGILRFSRRVVGPTRYFHKVRQVSRTFGFFVWELIAANLRVARDVVLPLERLRPAVIAIPLDARTDGEITLLACLITLTPGTLSVDVSEDRRTLYIHAMSIRDAEQVRQGIKRGFERRVLEVMR
jgi:multicomponent Na+:H+ antiporter subunit E